MIVIWNIVNNCHLRKHVTFLLASPSKQRRFSVIVCCVTGNWSVSGRFFQAESTASVHQYPGYFHHLLWTRTTFHAYSNYCSLVMSDLHCPIWRIKTVASHRVRVWMEFSTNADCHRRKFYIFDICSFCRTTLWQRYMPWSCVCLSVHVCKLWPNCWTCRQWQFGLFIPYASY